MNRYNIQIPHNCKLCRIGGISLCETKSKTMIQCSIGEHVINILACFRRFAEFGSTIVWQSFLDWIENYRKNTLTLDILFPPVNQRESFTNYNSQCYFFIWYGSKIHLQFFHSGKIILYCHGVWFSFAHLFHHVDIKHLFICAQHRTVLVVLWFYGFQFIRVLINIFPCCTVRHIACICHSIVCFRICVLLVNLFFFLHPNQFRVAPESSDKFKIAVVSRCIFAKTFLFFTQIQRFFHFTKQVFVFLVVSYFFLLILFEIFLKNQQWNTICQTFCFHQQLQQMSAVCQLNFNLLIHSTDENHNLPGIYVKWIIHVNFTSNWTEIFIGFTLNWIETTISWFIWQMKNIALKIFINIIRHKNTLIF